MRSLYLSLLLALLLAASAQASVVYTLSPSGTGGTRVDVSGDGVLAGVTFTNVGTLNVSQALVQGFDSGTSLDQVLIRDFAGTVGGVDNDWGFGFNWLPLPGTLSENFFSGATATDSLPVGTFFPNASPLEGGEFLLRPENASRLSVLATPGNLPSTLTVNTGFGIDTDVPFAQFIDFGTASWTNGTSTVSLRIVPEPSAALLLATGLAGLALRRRGSA